MGCKSTKSSNSSVIRKNRNTGAAGEYYTPAKVTGGKIIDPSEQSMGWIMAHNPTAKKTVRRVPSFKKVLDKLFSEIIRKRAMQRVGGCERCLSGKTDYKQLQCSHVIGRSNMKVRYDMDNAFGFCGGCHMLLEHNPVEHAEFAKEKLGRAYDLLRIRSTTRQKLDLELIYLFLKSELEKMK